MARQRRFQSMMTRLTVALLAGGLVLSVGAACLTLGRARLLRGAEAPNLTVAAADQQAQLRGQVINQTLLIAATTLLALLLIRRCVGGPLAEVLELVRVGTRHEPLRDLARQQRGEFRDLCEALADLVEQVEQASPRRPRHAAPSVPDAPPIPMPGNPSATPRDLLDFAPARAAASAPIRQTG